MLPSGYMVTVQKLLHIIRGLRDKKKGHPKLIGHPAESFKYEFTPREQT